MPRFLMQVLAIVLAVLTFVDPAHAQAGLQRKVDAYFAPMAGTNSFSGVVLVARGDRILAHKAYGLASYELETPHQLNDKFQIASVSKPITAAAVLRLVDQGRIDLEAPLSRILPSYPNADRLTVRQLLTHTAGVPNVNQMPIYRELGLQRRTPEQIVAAFKDAPAQFPPGSGYAYSNSNYALLALIIEKVSGTDYGSFLQREVLAPLGMTASGHRGDDAAVLPRMSPGYAPQGRTGLVRPAWFDWTVKTGNGSLYATAGDLHRFVRGYFGGRLLSAALLKAATSPAPGVPPPSPGFEWMPRDIGYGWMIDRHLGRARLHHAGTSPGFNAILAYYPDEQLTVVVLSNIYVNATVSASEALAAMALGEAYDPGPLGDPRMSAADIARVAGSYRFGDDFPARGMTLTISESDGRLSMSADEPQFGASPILPAGSLAYIARNSWARLTFEARPGAPADALVYRNAGLSFRAVRVR